MNCSNEKQHYGYAGVRRDLLPFESSFSKLAFIAYRNSLNTLELHRLISVKKRLSLCHGFLAVNEWFDQNKTRAVFGLNFPTCSEKRFLSRMLQLYPTLLTSGLRICPLCFQGGYHSYWFQFLDVGTCPIHGCRIERLCQSCGRELPWYGFYAQNFDQPYMCVYCRSPLNGAPILVDSQNEFCLHANEIEMRISDFESFISRLPIDNYRKYVIPNSRSNFSLWCRPDQLRSEVSREFDFPGKQNRSTTNVSTEILRWRVQMMNKIGRTGKIDDSICFAQLKSVWMVLKRRLEHWIFGKAAEKKAVKLMADIAKLDEFVFFKDFDLKHLAYGLFRIQFGNDIFFRPYQCSLSPSLRRMPEIGFSEQWQGRLPRAALMYGMLGAFAGLYLMLVNRSHRSKYLDFRRLALVDADFVAMSYAISGEGLCVGVVAFPKIAGLPVRSFSKGKLALGE